LHGFYLLRRAVEARRDRKKTDFCNLITLLAATRAPMHRHPSSVAQPVSCQLLVSVEFVLKYEESSAQLLADFYILPPCLG
jgi:hypothetical protein